MPRSEIPVDVLLNILEHVDIADLATMCRVNKVCCPYSQDVLYREIYVETRKESSVHQTLAQSTHLAKRVRLFASFYKDPDLAMKRVSWLDSSYEDPDLAMALRNMTSLRILILPNVENLDILDGCTFKLDSFDGIYMNCHSESFRECTISDCHDAFFRKFLRSQPSLKHLSLTSLGFLESPPLEATCLPNLTRIDAPLSLLQHLIPGRPLNEVISNISGENSIDLSFFALSTTPIQKLTIDYSDVFPTHVHLLASFLPSLTHFTLTIWDNKTPFKNEGVCGLPLY
jgi:hypothetical protein